MPLTNRKPRPISRTETSYRDDRLYIIACDDTFAPKQYFDFFRFSRIQVHVETSTQGNCSAAAVLESLLKYDHNEDDERWIVLDTDHYTQGSHQREFTRILMEARQKGVKVALSKPCFEVWLLLHHLSEDDVSKFTDATAVLTKLRETLGEYNKTRLKEIHYPLTTVVKAIKSASQLDSLVEGGEIPKATTTRIYKIWESIISSASVHQLPDELRTFKQT